MHNSLLGVVVVWSYHQAEFHLFALRYLYRTYQKPFQSAAYYVIMLLRNSSSKILVAYNILVGIIKQCNDKHWSTALYLTSGFIVR